MSGDLDCLCRSKNSMHWIDHPGSGSFAITADRKWAWGEGTINRINASCDPLGIPTLVKMDDKRVRIIVSIRSHSFIKG